MAGDTEDISQARSRKRRRKTNHLADLAGGCLIFFCGLIGFVGAGWLTFAYLRGGLLFAVAAGFVGLICGLLGGLLLMILFSATRRRRREPIRSRTHIAVEVVEEGSVEDDSFRYALSKVAAPAITLIVLSAICIGLLFVEFAFDGWYVLSGMMDRDVQVHGDSVRTNVALRAVWSLAMLPVNIVILLGAVQMKSLRSPKLARAACILALIPMLGPCFLLGIPFGIWGLVVLSDRRVSAAMKQ